MIHRPWSQAMRTALYGTAGFYRSQEPRGHFDTSARSELFAVAMSRLLERVDAALGRPEPFTVVDMGAGDGLLLERLLDHHDFDGRLRPVAVELRPRPAGLDPRVEWRDEPPQSVVGAVLACEYLDNVPCDVAEADEAGVARVQLVDTAGDTVPGEPVSGADADWLERWWPLRRPGERAEIGRPRDETWERLCATLDRGLALAIDYGHTRDSRPPFGTLTGYRDGRQLEPIPDGTRDLTAHVAMDSLDGRRCVQGESLRALGISADRPPLEQAASDPAGYLAALSNTGEAAGLLDPAGLGAHWWSWRPVGIADPMSP